MVDPSKKLIAWRESSGLSLQAMATLIGCKPGALWYWMRGTRCPSLKAALKLERHARIPVAAWTKKRKAA